MHRLGRGEGVPRRGSGPTQAGAAHVDPYALSTLPVVSLQPSAGQGWIVKYFGRPQGHSAPSIRGSTRHLPYIEVHAIEEPATASVAFPSHLARFPRGPLRRAASEDDVATRIW